MAQRPRWNDIRRVIINGMFGSRNRARERNIRVLLGCDGGSVECNKRLLSAYSTYFKEELKNPFVEQFLIFLTHIPVKHMQLIVDCIKNGHVVLMKGELPAFLKIAKELGFKGLKDVPYPTQNELEKESKIKIVMELKFNAVVTIREMPDTKIETTAGLKIEANSEVKCEDNVHPCVAPGMELNNSSTMVAESEIKQEVKLEKPEIEVITID